MLVTVIIFLREVLEAALILSVLLAVSFKLTCSRKWIVPAIVIGFIGASITAYYLGDISELIDGTGQEIMNSSFLLIMTILLNIICIWLFQYLIGNYQPALSSSLEKYITLILIINIGIVIMHEGSELSVYTWSYIQTHDTYLSLTIGGGFGMGIGASLGAIVYYLLINLQRQTLLRVAICILVLIAAGMASQAALYLIQSGWLPSQSPLWDTSGIIPERSLMGQILYALIGYEATPSLIQVVFYWAVVIFSISSMMVFMIVTSAKPRQILSS